MSESLWQQSLDEWSEEKVQSLIDERVPEGYHLEYKEQTPGKSGRTENFSEEFLETIVSMSNADGGLIIYGVSDAGNGRPGAITGVQAKGDLEAALRNKCDMMIQPKVTVDVRVITLRQPTTPDADKLMLVRVHPGANLPYSIQGTKVFVRVGPDDRPPSVRDLESLFMRRSELASSPVSHWDTALRDTFAFNLSSPDKPVALMVGLTPVFPIEPRWIGREEDLAFVELVKRMYSATTQDVQMLSEGVAYNPLRAENDQNRYDFACAYGDGTIACRSGLTIPYTAERGKRLDILMLWSILRRVLLACRTWPRDVCRASGPVTYSIKLANLIDAVLRLPEQLESAQENRIFVPTEGVGARRNTIPDWSASGIWEREGDLQVVIEGALGSLARQLQCEIFHDKVLMLRDLAARGNP